LKVLIKHIPTGLYANHDGWVKQIEEAYDFKDARSAIQYGWGKSLKNVEIHYMFDNPGQNFTTGAVNFP